MDLDDLAEKHLKEGLMGMLCDSCRSNKHFQVFLDVAFQEARQARKELKKREREMWEMKKEKEKEDFITEVENKKMHLAPKKRRL